jgi:UDP-N-acetylmuramate dehydrogenase
MNAGAHQQCIADILLWAKVLNPDGQIEILTPQDFQYQYRTSNLQGQNRLVLEAGFQLLPDSTKEAVMLQTQQNWQQRKDSQPYHLPSCGSVFRNPYPHAAGRLIEQLGLKGYQIGDAQVAHRHANFILNCGNAKAMDIFRLIRYVQEQVDRHWAIALEPEVRIMGDFSGC